MNVSLLAVCLISVIAPGLGFGVNSFFNMKNMGNLLKKTGDDLKDTFKKAGEQVRALHDRSEDHQKDTEDGEDRPKMMSLADVASSFNRLGFKLKDLTDLDTESKADGRKSDLVQLTEEEYNAENKHRPEMSLADLKSGFNRLSSLVSNPKGQTNVHPKARHNSKPRSNLISKSLSGSNQVSKPRSTSNSEVVSSDRGEIVEEEMTSLEESLKKSQVATAKSLVELRERVTDLTARLDVDMARTLDGFLTRIEKLEDHKETTHTMLKELKLRDNKHNHACGSPPEREGADVMEHDGFARYECKPGFIQFKGTRHTSRCEDDRSWSKTVDIVCKDLMNCQTMLGRDRAVYSGTRNVTMSGKACQPWSDHRPHGHWFWNDAQFKDTSGDVNRKETVASASNYCRDPGHLKTEKKVWCFTMDPDTRWESCDITWC